MLSLLWPFTEQSPKKSEEPRKHVGRRPKVTVPAPVKRYRQLRRNARERERQGSLNNAFDVLRYESRGGTSDFRLPTSDFQLPTSDFRLQTSDFRLQTSDFRLPTSDFQLPTSNFRLQTSDFRLLVLAKKTCREHCYEDLVTVILKRRSW